MLKSFSGSYGSFLWSTTPELKVEEPSRIV